MRVNSSVYIGRPVDEVFAYMADPGDGLGTHVREALANQGRITGVNLEVTESELNRRICFRARGSARAHGCYELGSDGPGTLLSLSVTVELKGDDSMLERYVRQAVELAAEADLAQLRQTLEPSAGG